MTRDEMEAKAREIVQAFEGRLVDPHWLILKALQQAREEAIEEAAKVCEEKIRALAAGGKGEG